MWAAASGVVATAEQTPGGYADYAAFRRQMQQLAASPLARLESLGRTPGGREVLLLCVGSGKLDAKPAVLIVGGVDPPRLLGSHLALDIARRLVVDGRSDPETVRLLKQVTFYVIPRVSPDASEAFFQTPAVERSVNLRPMDDDHDGRVDEDGPEDLNGDGLITAMRVEDPAGPMMPHPDDPRVLIKADPKKNERGCWRLLIEGRDNDQDGELNEDPPGGVAFDRNFTFEYPYFEPGAGPHQVSEVETRAVADFAFSHPNIAMVVSFGRHDNLVRPWKPEAGAEKQTIKTHILSADAGYCDFVAQKYRELLGIGESQAPPDAPDAGGSFAHWAYFHLGRWSFTTPGWWLPCLDRAADDGAANDGAADQRAGEKQSSGSDAHEPATQAAGPRACESKIEEPHRAAKTPNPADKQPPDDRRGRDDLAALRWFEQRGIEGFVAWRPIEHPDFPDRCVEIGGFKPFVRLNPPESQLDSLGQKHYRFVRWLAGLLPRLEIVELKTEALPGGVWRVHAVVINRGYLPTMSRMGEITGEPYPLQAELGLPAGAELAAGHKRVRLPRLEGSGGKAEQTWLVVFPKAEAAGELKLRVWAPAVGQTVRRVQLRAAAGSQPGQRHPRPQPKRTKAQ